MHLIKEPAGHGVYKYAVSGNRTRLNFAEKLQTIFRESITSIAYAQNIVVLKTMPGPVSYTHLDVYKRQDLKTAKAKVREILERYSFQLDLDAKVYQLSIGQMQRVEIVKALYRLSLIHI